MAQDTWKVRPGRPPGPKTAIAEFLTRAYQADEWVRRTYRHLPPARRMTKERFCERLHITHPTVNKYLRGAAIPFPLPPLNHLIWVVDADDQSTCWVNPKLCETLHHDEEFYIGRNARETLRPSRSTEPGHGEALQQLRRGEIDVHECTTQFQRADGWWVPLKIWVRYGDLYRVWFAEGEVVGEAIPPLEANSAREAPNTYNMVLIDPNINRNYRLTLDPELLGRPVLEVNGVAFIPTTPTVTVRPGAIVFESNGNLRITPSAEACQTCRGSGRVRHDVPVGHPDFGFPFPCPDCR